MNPSDTSRPALPHPGGAFGPFWDQRFAEPGYKYGTEPNAFLRERALRLLAASPSRVLVPGDGEGRNGVWLAEQGHSVLSVDASPVGLAKTTALAQQRAVAHRLNTELADLADWAPPPPAFDALVLIYLHLPGAIRRSAHRRLAQALRPGGWVILEAFHPAQLQHSSGGPRDADMLYTPDVLREDFAGLVDEHLGLSCDTLLSEGPGHQGLGHVTRWVGQRRA